MKISREERRALGEKGQQICCRCGMQKLLTEFYKRKSKPLGVDYKCKECSYVEGSFWRERNKEKLQKYYLDNKVAFRANGKKWRQSNKERVNGQAKKRRDENPEKSRISCQKWRRNNLEKDAKRTQDYRVRKISAKPSWANDEYISLWYMLAKIEEKRTGKDVHVDHIVPLRGKTVCGLHCEDNMQLLFGTENSSKGNRWWNGQG